jgi:fatty acid-binding protein DegV
MHLKVGIEEYFHQSVPYVCEFTPVVGVHAGPGVVGAAFYSEE